MKIKPNIIKERKINLYLSFVHDQTWSNQDQHFESVPNWHVVWKRSSNESCECNVSNAKHKRKLVEQFDAFRSVEMFAKLFATSVKSSATFTQQISDARSDVASQKFFINVVKDLATYIIFTLVCFLKKNINIIFFSKSKDNQPNPTLQNTILPNTTVQNPRQKKSTPPNPTLQNPTIQN